MLLLLLGMLLVGATEELMFRPTGVHVLGAKGLSEGARRAVVERHLRRGPPLDAISAGGGAVGRAIVVSFAGYFSYLTRRATGVLVAGALLHGLFDFSVVSGEIGGTFYAGSALALLVCLVAGALLLLRRRRIEPG